MNNLSRMDVLQTSEQLVQKEFIMFFSERLITFYYLCKISVHHLRNYVPK
jgi:hypothetical protein